MAEKIVVKNVRISYANLFEPKIAKGSTDAKYSVSLIIPKDHPQVEKIQGLIDKVVEEKFGKAALKKLGKKGGLHSPLRDGDEEREDDPVYAGCYFLGASSKRKPQVVDRQVAPILEESEAYSGCYANVSVALFPFDVDTNKGCGAGLNNVQILKLGERLGGAANADEDFESVDDDDEDDIELD